MEKQQETGKPEDDVQQPARRYQPPVDIPLDFDTAVEGLLAVKPKQKATTPKKKAQK